MSIPPHEHSRVLPAAEPGRGHRIATLADDHLRGEAVPAGLMWRQVADAGTLGGLFPWHFDAVTVAVTEHPQLLRLPAPVVHHSRQERPQHLRELVGEVVEPRVSVLRSVAVGALVVEV
jgi:hypothetical protein